MPLNIRKKSKDDNIDYKARLERKLCIARETPEPLFDISSCNLKSVPSGVYSLCKVFRKEVLYLQDNLLTDLNGGGAIIDLFTLTFLDIHCNKLSFLPEAIGNLVNLEVFSLSRNFFSILISGKKILDCSYNQLTRLPDSIGYLNRLRKLNASNNKLISIPSNIGNCRWLNELDLDGNISLKVLPPSLVKLKHLKTLLLGPTITYPPMEVVDKGIEAIINFIAHDQSLPIEEDVDADLLEVQPSRIDDHFSVIQEKFIELERKKEQQQRERIDLEKNLALDNEREIMIQQSLLNQRKKLVEDIKLLESGLESEIFKFQEQRDIEKSNLIAKCLQEEEVANQQVRAMLENFKTFQNKLIFAADEDAKLEQEILANIYLKPKVLEKAAILESMNKLVDDESRHFEAYTQTRDAHIGNWLNNESELSMRLHEAIERSNRERYELEDAIATDERLQKAAVAALLEQSDAHSWQLAQQVAAVERQLARLTQIELARRDVHINRQMEELCNSRMELTELLMSLFEEQQKRRQHLVDTLRHMESAENGESFWLEQYQRLLDSSGSKMVAALKSIDPQLIHCLLLNGISHYLPLLLPILQDNYQLKCCTLQQLEQLGIESTEDQNSILEAFQYYLDQRDARVAPSAPEDFEASAPPLALTSEQSSFADGMVLRHADECIICFDNAPNLLFIPCGHICCCTKCGSLTQCPLCRSPIDHLMLVKSL